MAPAPEYLPLAFIHLARAYDAELGSPERGDERPGEPNSQVVPFSGRPIMKDLKPRIKNLTPWPYVAIAVIALILLFVLGYALSNCYRKMKLRNGAPKPRYLNLSLLQRSVMAGKPSTGVKVCSLFFGVKDTGYLPNCNSIFDVRYRENLLGRVLPKCFKPPVWRKVLRISPRRTCLCQGARPKVPLGSKIVSRFRALAIFRIRQHLYPSLTETIRRC